MDTYEQEEEEFYQGLLKRTEELNEVFGEDILPRFDDDDEVVGYGNGQEDEDFCHSDGHTGHDTGRTLFLPLAS